MDPLLQQPWEDSESCVTRWIFDMDPTNEKWWWVLTLCVFIELCGGVDSGSSRV